MSGEVQASILMGTLARPGWDEYVPTLLDQTVPADEFITVVDRPTDASERAALEARWPKLSFVFNDDNLGLTKSLNRGLARARGTFVFRADDDDHYFPNRIERQLEAFASTGADFVSSWGEGVGEAGKAYLIRAPEGDSAIKRALMKRNVFLHPSLAFRRATVERLGGYDESFIYAQDYALYLAGIRAGARFAVVQEPLVRRFYAATSISVGRRHAQAMYSCGARILHSAHNQDRASFFRTLAQYSLLVGAPSSLRRARRRLFGWIGRGA